MHSISLSLTVHNVFYVGVWNAECLCLNLFAFRSPIPPSCVQMTHDMLTYRTITSAPIHELQIAATFPLLYTVTCSMQNTAAVFMVEIKLCNLFRPTITVQHWMISEYLFGGRGPQYIGNKCQFLLLS